MTSNYVIVSIKLCLDIGNKEIVLCYCGGRFVSGSYINNINQKYGYLVNGSKNWLIVKSDVLADEIWRFDLEFGDEVNIKTEIQRH